MLTQHQFGKKFIHHCSPEIQLLLCYKLFKKPHSKDRHKKKTTDFKPEQFKSRKGALL